MASPRRAASSSNRRNTSAVVVSSRDGKKPRRKRREESDEATRAAFDALRAIVHALRVSTRMTERDIGLSVAQLFVLESLADGTPRSVSDLAAATMTDKSSVSVVVRRLVDAGFVRRTVAADDARRAELTLTTAGAAALRRAPVPPQRRLMAALVALPAAQREALAETLTTVARAMGDLAPTLFFEEDDGEGEEPAPAPRTSTAARPGARRR